MAQDAVSAATTTMSAEVGSVKPNPYIFDIENRRKRKPRLAHDLGAGAKCNKCGDKCPGFELHFWRKICMNCRCGKDDHDVQDDDEDIGKVVIGKLFERPARTKKEELEFSYGNNLDMVNEETGKPEKVKFDWVPPNTERNLAARYMALLPPEKRPVAGSEAAKERRKQLEQQVPLYDMDASQRCENMPTEELQSFEAYMERIRTQVAGQGIVQEIAGMPTPSVAQPLPSHLQKDPQLNSGTGNIVGHSYPVSPVKTGLPYKEDDSTYAMPYTQITDQPYQQKVPQGLKEFMGGMIGESGRFLASSDTYGVAPAMSRPLRGLGQDQGVPGITAQLSGLQTGGSQQGFPSPDSYKDQLTGGLHAMKGPHQHATSPGNEWPPPPSFVSGHDQRSNLATTASSKQGLPGQEALVPGKQGFLPGQEGFVPGKQGLPGQEGFVPGKQGLPGQEGFVPGKQGLPGQEGFVPGKQGLPGQEGFVPGKQGLPSQEGFVPGKQGLPGQEGFVPGKQGLPGQEGFVPGKQGLPGQEGFVPGKQSFLPGQEGFVPGKQGLLPGQKGFVPGKQSLFPGQEGFVPGKQGLFLGQEGFVPGKQGLLPGQESFLPGKQGHLPNVDGPLQKAPIITSVDQAFSPGRDTMIHRYQMGGSEPATTLAYEKAGVLGSHRPSQRPAGLSPSKEGGRGILPQMSPREGSITNKEAVQAPYDAYKETLSGGMQVAPGSAVTVLFPGESHVLRSQDMSGEMPGQKSKFSCQYCSLPMTVGDVAIFCERAGTDKCWHPACFCCFTCKELLADLIYFYKDGKVYCGRHFTDAMDMPRCKACDELIFGNSWTRADNFNWHIHHYCCYVCDTPLAGQRYVPDKNSFPYCLPCHMAYQAKTCQTCEEKIAPEENRCSHRGYFYHANPQCFQCYSCKTALLGKKFKMAKNWLFCSNECVQAAAEDIANNPNPKEMPQ
ncbi:LIM domain-containing protein 1-like isoform X3 [Scylla paramamosain]|uniref:LIM domain-containing protein 1-like isoform X3 n=1 Tax=Scylla paramamosain TaxID=85552 RepID=UPI003083B626